MGQRAAPPGTKPLSPESQARGSQSLARVPSPRASVRDDVLRFCRTDAWFPSSGSPHAGPELFVCHSDDKFTEVGTTQQTSKCPGRVLEPRHEVLTVADATLGQPFRHVPLKVSVHLISKLGLDETAHGQALD